MLKHFGPRLFAAAHFRAIAQVANDVQPNPLPSFDVGGIAGSFIRKAQKRLRLRVEIEGFAEATAVLSLREVEQKEDAAADKRAAVIQHNNAFLLLAA
jgi:hypothetical protein